MRCQFDQNQRGPGDEMRLHFEAVAHTRLCGRAQHAHTRREAAHSFDACQSLSAITTQQRSRPANVGLVVYRESHPTQEFKFSSFAKANSINPVNTKVTGNRTLTVFTDVQMLAFLATSAISFV